MDLSSFSDKFKVTSQQIREISFLYTDTLYFGIKSTEMCFSIPERCFWRYALYVLMIWERMAPIQNHTSTIKRTQIHAHASVWIQAAIEHHVACIKSIGWFLLSPNRFNNALAFYVNENMCTCFSFITIMSS